ncbi:hypothetical protein ALO68_101686 [Pseudomonas syringae pv. helianthi]|uniref:Uncharacterized protein n=1 Tax=Pseudomonas syringae pv. helianthi TaxID=251654 RepID=A0A0P9TP66_9PSED|nr:hypothetical protein [Pseudomonas syringae group genomosp. 7]KPX42734.1 hypothetical protein ALO68_101686 [Pseudomonas syringae pv. helianthi]UNB64184.1 hypothetical protein MME54_05170 [Pseudomonas syringae pv. helianthi]
MSNSAGYTHVAKRIAECLDTVATLSDVLAASTVAREDADEGSQQSPLDSRCEAGVQTAIRLLAMAAYADLQSMAQGLGIPE